MKDKEQNLHLAYIALGSNIGNKILNCQKGIAVLTGNGHTVLKNQSHFYETEPVDYTDQDWFVNAVIEIETTLDPFQLLKELKTIEKDAGRDFNAIRFGPRILDMDILLYDDTIINNLDEVQIPHPRMHNRRFVLQPLCDIAPNIIHPVLKKDMQNLLSNLNDNDKVAVLI